MHNPHPLVPLLAGVALLLIALAIPLILRRIPRNRWYGIRTPRTRNGSEAEWYAGNRKGGIVLLAAASLTLAGLALLR